MSAAPASAAAASAPRKYDFDLFVIGGGSGGVATGRRAAALGAKVGLAEYGRLGGTCVNVGCVPKKLLMYGVHFRDEMEVAAGFGYTIDEKSKHIDWTTLQKKVLAETTRLNGIYKGMLDRTGVQFFNAKAKLVDPNTIALVEEDGKESKQVRKFTAERILIATGSYSWTPSPKDVPGIEHAVTSNAMFDLPVLPKHVVIVGGGYIAVEFAGIFNGSGQTKVVQAVRGTSILQNFDIDLRFDLMAEMIKKGIDVRAHTEVIKIEKKAEKSFVVHFKDNRTGVTSTTETELVMYATGRVPNTPGLGLEDVGVKVKEKGIAVNEFSQTNFPHIYAVGDVTNRVMLTPVAIAEGKAIVATVWGKKPTSVSYANIPTAVFSQPELGTVGFGEEEALMKFPEDVDIYRARFRPMKYTLTEKDEKVMLKVIVQRSTDKVLGVHMIGYGAAEVVQCIGVAVTCGATKAQFDHTIALHPSTSEELVLMTEKVAVPTSIAVKQAPAVPVPEEAAKNLAAVAAAAAAAAAAKK